MRIFLAILVLSGLMSCRFGWGERVSGNGRIKTEERQVSDFKGVEVSGDIAVHVKQDAVSGVRLETDENLLPYIEVFTSGSKLVIRTKRGYNLDASKDIIAYVSGPTFDNIDISGSSDVVSDGTIRSENELSVSVSGSGSLYMEVEMEKIKAHASGSGSVNLRGHTTDLDGSASGSGDLKCFDLSSENAKLGLSGSGNAEVTVNKQLDIHVSGSGNVQYKGNANVSQHISGAGSVKKVE